MDWRTHIHADLEVLRGKPVIRGTRLSVEFILRLFAAGWSEQMILENYPTLTQGALQAVFVYAADGMSDDLLLSIEVGCASEPFPALSR
jgi:uncharacterized protein (DUF433 family)